MRKEAKIALSIFMLLTVLILGGCSLFESVPNAPNISLTWTLTATTVYWPAVSGAKEYIVYYGEYGGSSSPSTFTRLGSTSGTSYTDYTTKIRYYAVKASNSAGESGFSNVEYSDN